MGEDRNPFLQHGRRMYGGLGTDLAVKTRWMTESLKDLGKGKIRLIDLEKIFTRLRGNGDVATNNNSASLATGEIGSVTRIYQEGDIPHPRLID